MNIFKQKRNKLEIFNLGSGIGTSVLEMIDIMKNVSGKNIPYEIKPRRKGDLDIVYCLSVSHKPNIKMEDKNVGGRHVSGSVELLPKNKIEKKNFRKKI